MVEQGQLKEAGFGRGKDYEKNKNIRGDLFVWLSELSKDQSKYEAKEELGKLIQIKELLTQVCLPFRD